MPIEPWLTVLRWKSVPNFVAIHKLGSSERFLKLYHSDDPHLTAFFANLMEGLETKDPEPTIRIESPPGWGKTSCFFYLREDKELSQKFYYSIIDASRLIGSKGLDRDATFTECFESVYAYLHECSPDKNFAQDLLANDNLSALQKLSTFLRVIEKGEMGVEQRLVVVIDDVDVILQEEDVIGAVLEIFRFLKTPDIIKWLAIRGVTYENYTRKTQEQIDTLFPIHYDFPNVSLSAIVNRRIQEVSDQNAINPFSERLCDLIQSLYKGDHREGLATLKELLQTISPGDLKKKANTKSVQEHIERLSVHTLLKRQAIPNIFSIDGNVNTLLPIPMEVMQLTSFRRVINDEFLKLVGQSLSSKYEMISGGKYLAARIKHQDILDAVEYLVRLGLIELQQNQNISLTIRGEIAKRFLGQKYYVHLCKNALKENPENDVFWRIAEAVTPYHAILMDDLFHTSDA